MPATRVRSVQGSRNSVAEVDADRERRVLGTAVTRAAAILGLTQSTLARALGVSDATASRLAAGTYRLDPGRKEWELATLIVRLFRALDSIAGGNEETARAWLRGDNAALNARPIDLIVGAEGLIRVVHYLDAARGRV